MEIGHHKAILRQDEAGTGGAAGVAGAIDRHHAVDALGIDLRRSQIAGGAGTGLHGGLIFLRTGGGLSGIGGRSGRPLVVALVLGNGILQFLLGLVQLLLVGLGQLLSPLPPGTVQRSGHQQADNHRSCRRHTGRDQNIDPTLASGFLRGRGHGFRLCHHLRLRIGPGLGVIIVGRLTGRLLRRGNKLFIGRIGKGRCAAHGFLASNTLSAVDPLLRLGMGHKIGNIHIFRGMESAATVRMEGFRGFRGMAKLIIIHGCASSSFFHIIIMQVYD